MLVFWETIKYKKKLFQCWANSVAHQVRYDVCSLSTAVWPSLKLTGDEGFLLLRFRPRTVLPLVRTPDHAPSQHSESVDDSDASLSVLASRHQWLSHVNEHLCGADSQRHSSADECEVSGE